MRYIITVLEYLTIWVEAMSVKNCTAEIATWFIFENIIMRFGCAKVLMSD